MKSASIIKFKNGKTLIYPKIIVENMGSFSIPPYLIEHNLNYKQITEKLLPILNQSIQSKELPKSEDGLFFRENIKITGIKNMKELHSDSKHVSVYLKDGNFYLTPSINKGSKLGYQYDLNSIILPFDSNLDALAFALKKAFERSR